jgi:hypothetical protein
MNSKLNFLCVQCSKHFTRIDNRKRHEVICKNKQVDLTYPSSSKLVTNLGNTFRIEESSNKFSENPSNVVENVKIPAQTNDRSTYLENNVYRNGFQNRLLDGSRDTNTDFDYVLKAPFCMTISGATQTGKSTLTQHILQRRAEIIEPLIDNITYCYTEWQENLFNMLKHNIPQIKFHRGIPTDITGSSIEPKIFVLDDMMQEVATNPGISTLFTRTSHHRNISVIFLVQDFFQKNLKTITRNCQYLCIMKNPRDSAHINIISRQMNGGRKNVTFEQAYEDCCKKPYGYLFLDFTQNQQDQYRIRDSIFPEECTVYCKE